MAKSIPITLITGYLGSGKTTLLNNILRNNQGFKVAVIVNDIGEVNIDADIIAKDGIVSGKEESLLSLENGCICCTLRTDLLEQIQEIIEAKKFDYIVIEASGICEPIPIAQTICAMEDAYEEYKMPKLCYLDSIISVVDAKRMSDEFASGQELLNDATGEEAIANLIIEQIEFCNTIILNKVDEVTEEELHIVKDVIKTLQPQADIIETNYSQVDVEKLLKQNKFDFERIATSAGWYDAIENGVEEHHEEHEHHHHHDEEHECHCHEDGHECHCHHDHEDGHCCCGHDHEDGHDHVAEYGINTFVYQRREPMDRKKFLEYIGKPWPKKMIRAKGITYFKDEKDMSYMFEQAGSLKDLTPAGPWLACESPDFVEQVLEQNPDLAKDFDPFYGDRMVKIVFIGSNISEKEISAELDEI